MINVILSYTISFQCIVLYYFLPGSWLWSGQLVPGCAQDWVGVGLGIVTGPTQDLGWVLGQHEIRVEIDPGMETGLITWSWVRG